MESIQHITCYKK